MSRMTLRATILEISRLLDSIDAGRPSIVTIDAAARAIRAAAFKLKCLSEQECNGVIGPDGYAKWDDTDQAETDRQRAKAEKRAAHAIEMVMDTTARERIDIEWQGDPRGAPIVVHHKGREDRIAAFY